MTALFFNVLRNVLVVTTGRGYDRSPWLNNIHHKLSYRLHKLLPVFGITGIQKVQVPDMPDRFMYIRAEDGGVAHQLIMYREYEPFESQLVRTYLKPGMVIYNIGANLGYYATVASECVGESGRVFAFEPEPKNLELLRRTIFENACTNVEIQPVAIAAESGVAALSLSATNSGDHQLTTVVGRAQVQVATISLDDFISDDRPMPNAIIMDVQGSELDVLRGASTLLSSDKPLLLFMEYWPGGLNGRHANGAKELLHMLEDAKFELSYIDERRSQINPVSSDWLLKNVLRNSEANLLAVRS